MLARTPRPAYLRGMPRLPSDPYAVRMLEGLLRLRAAGGLGFAETAHGRGIWRWRFRAGGDVVVVDLDTTVLEMRCYHNRDEVAMGHVPQSVMDALLGRAPPPPAVPKADPAAVLAELREVVADWRRGNARIDIRPPVKVGHPDNWNGA
jgi:hypothetical protein